MDTTWGARLETEAVPYGREAAPTATFAVSLLPFMFTVFRTLQVPTWSRPCAATRNGRAGGGPKTAPLLSHPTQCGSRRIPAQSRFYNTYRLFATILTPAASGGRPKTSITPRSLSIRDEFTCCVAVQLSCPRRAESSGLVLRATTASGPRWRAAPIAGSRWLESRWDYNQQSRLRICVHTWFRNQSSSESAGRMRLSRRLP